MEYSTESRNAANEYQSYYAARNRLIDEAIKMAQHLVTEAGATLSEAVTAAISAHELELCPVTDVVMTDTELHELTNYITEAVASAMA